MNERLVLWVAPLACTWCWACGSAEPGTITLDLAGETKDIAEPDRTGSLPDLAGDSGGPAEVSLDMADLELSEGEVDAVFRMCDPGACPCETNSDCDSGFCVETGNGKFCTIMCIEECPPGFACTNCLACGPDVVFLCLPTMAYQCRPCIGDADCNEPGMAHSARCADFGPAGSFCTVPCGGQKDCGEGYACAEMQFNDGPETVCIPPTDEECTCNAAAKKAGASTPCFEQNDFGTCTGKRTCEAGGLSACDAPIPAAETCNALDDDCDGSVDEELGQTTCGQGECEHTVSNCVAGIPVSCDPLEGAAEEACDSLDNDCDGTVDNGFADSDANGTADCLDEDDDGDGIPDVQDNCPQVQNPGQENLDLDTLGNACDPDDDNDGVADPDDCGPLDKTVFPGAPESCNGKDDDCDQDTDEGLGQTTCGLGACKHTVDNCINGKPANCNPLDGAADETCDGLDNDCDGTADEPDAQGCQKHYVDIDGDGYGADALAKCTCGPYDLYTVTVPGDCQPLDQAIHPGAKELCDGLDQDCDGMPDNGFADTDKDGLADCIDEDPDGDGLVGLLDNCPLVYNPGQEDFDLDTTGDACDPDDDNDLAADNLDCGPLDPTIHPGAAESCDGVDQDCSGQADDGLGQTTCGLGPCEHTVENCQDGDLQVCDPMEGASPEECDGLDNDCDGIADDGLGSTTCGLGACTHTVENCVAAQPQECDPLAGTAPELCDHLDNNCNGLVDDGLGQTTCGLGICQHTVENCVAGVPQQCDPFQGKLEEKCDGLDNDCDGQTDEGSTCSVPVAPLSTLQANIYSVWDIDFDALGNTYLTSYISGPDFMRVVTPQGNVTTLYGIADWNMGYGEVKPDGSVKIVSYGFWGPTGIGLYTEGAFKIVVPITPTTCNVTHNSSGYDLYAPIDPVWGYDGYFYAGGMAGTGDVSRFTEGGDRTTIATFSGCVNALDATPEKLLFVGEGKNLHQVDLATGEKKLLHTFDTIVFSLAAWSKGSRVYVETYDGTIREVNLASGQATQKWKLSSHGFLEVGPDGALYRLVGLVNGPSTLERYELTL